MFINACTRFIAVALVGIILACVNYGTVWAAEGSNNGPIIIGANLEMSGGVADFGQSELKGIKLAIKETNESGGVLGRQLTLVIADNKSEPVESSNAMTKLIVQDNAVAVLGAVASSDTMAARADSQ